MKPEKRKNTPSLDEIEAAINECEAQNQNNQKVKEPIIKIENEGWLQIGEYFHSHNSRTFTGKTKCA